MNYLGIDYGKKRVGLAVADSNLKMAAPFDVIADQGDDFVIAEIQKVVKQEDIDEIIVGLPIALSGKITEQTKDILNFCEILKEKTKKPVHKEDERMTSRLADTLLKDIKDRKKQDAVAAMIILQSYVDKQS